MLDAISAWLLSVLMSINQRYYKRPTRHREFGKQCLLLSIFNITFHDETRKVAEHNYKQKF